MAMLLIGVTALLVVGTLLLWSVRHRGLAAMLLISLGVLAIGVPLLWILYYTSTYSTVSGFVDNIADAFNLPSELAAAATALLIVPAAAMSGFIFSISRQRRTLGIIMLTVGIAAYWVLIWVGTSDHMVTADGGHLKCYVITKDGVRYFEKEQVDPETGQLCKWIEPSDVHYVQEIDERIRSGKPPEKIPIKNGQDYEFFATGTNGPIPRIWFAKTPAGFDFYDSPGFHPTLGVPLEPVTPDIVKQWIEFNANLASAREAELQAENEKRAADEARRAEEARMLAEKEKIAAEKEAERKRIEQETLAKQQEMDKERRARAAEEERIKKLRALVDAGAKEISLAVAVLPRQPNSELNLSAASAIERALKTQSDNRVSNTVFSQEFHQDHQAQATLLADSRALSETGVFEVARTVALITASADCAVSELDSDLRVCKLASRLLTASATGILGTNDLLTVGAGVSDGLAIQNAAERAAVEVIALLERYLPNE